MATTTQERDLESLTQKQIAQAEELLFSGPEKSGFAKDLFFGRFRSESILPYPTRTPAQQQASDEVVAEVREFAEKHINPDRIDREADIPTDVIHGLGDVGVMGMCVSPKYGGRGLNQQDYCRVMEPLSDARHPAELRGVEQSRHCTAT